MKPKVLTKIELEKNPSLVWNTFVDLVALTKYDDLSAEQRPAHLIFWYDSEVYNGGHLQYFENRKGQRLEETIEALRMIGAECQTLILREAEELWLSRPRPRISTTEEFSVAALEEYSELDSRTYACVPSLHEHLRKHLASHQSWFVTITDSCSDAL
jgi:hypothetical protein